MKNKLLFSVFVYFIILILLSLGFWQIYRLNWKLELIRQIENSLKNDLSFRAAFLEGAFTVPGDGCIDYKPLFDILKNKDYSGWLVVEAEQDPAKANPLEYAKIGYKYLTETLKRSNIEIFKN